MRRIGRRELLCRAGGTGLGLPLAGRFRRRWRGCRIPAHPGHPQFEVDADSAPMRRVYDVAREYGVPVLLMLRRITCDNGARMLRLKS